MSDCDYNYIKFRYVCAQGNLKIISVLQLWNCEWYSFFTVFIFIIKCVW